MNLCSTGESKRLTTPSPKNLLAIGTMQQQLVWGGCSPIETMQQQLVWGGCSPIGTMQQQLVWGGHNSIHHQQTQILEFLSLYVQHSKLKWPCATSYHYGNEVNFFYSGFKLRSKCSIWSPFLPWVVQETIMRKPCPKNSNLVAAPKEGQEILIATWYCHRNWVIIVLGPCLHMWPSHVKPIICHILPLWSGR